MEEATNGCVDPMDSCDPCDPPGNDCCELKSAGGRLERGWEGGGRLEGR